MTLRQRRQSLDLEQYVNPTDSTFEVATDVILCVDPAFVPRELLAELLTPGADGIARGRIYDRPVVWYPSDTSRFDIKLVYTNWPNASRCGLCPGHFEPFELEFRWDGMAVCDDCAPEELVELRDAACVYASEQAERLSDNREGTWDYWVREYLRR